MRRVARTDSPEVVRVSEDSPESSFRELDDAFLQTQTRIWLGEVLHNRFDEDTPIADLLADGELLFRVSKVVWKMLLKKHVELKNSKLFISERTSFAKSDGRYMPYSKVDSFFKICQILGLTGVDLFSPSDVVEKRDVRRVCMCIRSLSKKAMSKQLSVPDFDIVTYTIAMPTDFVGGICKSLEQSRSSSSSSGSCSTDFRNLNGQESYSGHDERSHDYSSESDEAESKLNETELENPPPNSSFHTTNEFNLKPEDLPQGSVSNCKRSNLEAYNGLEDQTNGENGHKCRQHEKSILLESVGSTCNSITDSDNHDKWNSDIVCCQKCFVSHVKSPSIKEVRMGGKGGQPCNYYVLRACLPESSISDSLSSCAVENGEIIKTITSGTEKVTGTNAFQSQGGICRCKRMKWFQNEKNEDLYHLIADNFDGKGGSNMDAYSRTSTASSVEGYASPDYSIKDESFCSDYSSHSYNMVLLDSDSPESLLSVAMKNKDSHGQAVGEERFCLRKFNLSLERTAALPTIGRPHQGKPTAGKFSFPTINTYENVTKLGLIADISSNEQFTDENLKENIESPRNCTLYTESDDLASSTLKTCDWIMPSQYAITSHTALSDSDQGFTDILYRYYSTDDNTCSKPSCGEFEAEQQLILDTAIMEKTNLFNCVVARDANQKFYDAEAFKDEDAALDIVFPLNTKANGMIGDCHIHESYSNMISAWNGLRSGNLVIQNQSEMLSEDGPENWLNNDSFEAKRGFLVQGGKNLLEILSQKEQSNNCHASGSFNETTSDLIGVDTYNLHPMSLPEEEYSSTSTYYGESSEETPPVEERKKETEVSEEDALTKLASSGKRKDGNTGNIVFKSIAGSCTMIGALLVFLYLRRKKNSEKNSHTVVSLRAKISSQEDHTQKKVIVDSSYKKYPGERLML